jgi:hopene-associated glycosyltransferase HpnB
VLGLGVVAALAAVSWVYLLIAHGQFWRTTQRLPQNSKPEPDRWPGVVAIVPARDEADMLPVALPTLLGQEYPGQFRVVLVDDCSSDGTAEVAARLAAKADPPLQVVTGKPREPGWTGKVWAMHQGLDAAGANDGYLLFTDADIAWAPGALRDLAAAAGTDDRDLVSQMALLRTKTTWERILVPAFVYFFAQLYPFRRVNNATARTAAAAGGCMLVRRAAINPSEGLAPIKNALIDDVALGQLIKGQNGNTWLGLTTSIKSVRRYDTLGSLWRMVARSAYTQLRYSPPLLAGTVAGLLLIYLVPPAAAIAGLATGSTLATAAGLAGWAVMSITYLPMLRLYRLSPLRAPTLPLIALLYTAMTVDSARRHYAGRGGEWKGRTGSAASGRLRFYCDQHTLGRKPRKGRVAPLPRRRRVYPDSAGGQSARGVPRRPRPHH